MLAETPEFGMQRASAAGRMISAPVLSFPAQSLTVAIGWIISAVGGHEHAPVSLLASKSAQSGQSPNGGAKVGEEKVWNEIAVYGSRSLVIVSS